jgi:DegT/DnrJ/EryC1/StrS aminotransferase family
LRVTKVWRIPYANLGAQFVEERAELMARIEAILAGGMHVGGPEIEALECEIADYVGTRHAVALNSGTDALIFGMIAAGIGTRDEVITPRTPSSPRPPRSCGRAPRLCSPTSDAMVSSIQKPSPPP